MENMQGSVSISTENIFPIIKKWLYSEKDIFLREVVSNASDAISKLKKLISVGEASVEETEWKIEVSLDKEAGTITIFDNGIGMTQEEVVKYINQIAFSGAKDFLEKYQGKTDDAQIIGHFGLGFYSVFMVSDKVEIDTKSYQEGAEAVHWESVSGMDYAITPSETEEVLILRCISRRTAKNIWTPSSSEKRCGNIFPSFPSICILSMWRRNRKKRLRLKRPSKSRMLPKTKRRKSRKRRSRSTRLRFG